MNLSPSDWLDMMRSGWTDRPFPAWWDRSYSEWIQASPAQWWSMFYGPGPAGSPWRRTGGATRRHHGPHCKCDDCGCGCRRCGPDPCECFCCIGDVDFAVYARVGEQRVIPIVVENERRREKHITLELSGWTTRGGNPAPVDTVLCEPKTFTLTPCGEQKVTLIVRIRGVNDPNSGQQEPNQQPSGEGGDTAVRTVPPDVDSCLVATADLRLVGCDHRPLRIAVAILPRDCDPYTVRCGCTCC